MKRFIVILLFVMCTLFALSTVPAGASSPEEIDSNIIYYEDGSYSVLELVVYTPVVGRSSSSVTGSRTVAHYSASNELLYRLAVTGTFYYDGVSATATNASYSYTIYNDAWTLKKGEAYCSGNQAIAEATFNGGFLINRKTTVTLTCAPDGTLS